MRVVALCALLLQVTRCFHVPPNGPSMRRPLAVTSVAPIPYLQRTAVVQLLTGTSGAPDGNHRNRVLLGSAAGGAILALASGIVSGRVTTVVVQAFFTIYSATSVVRLFRNGKRRAALTLTLSVAARRFCTRWWQYATIPLFAGAVGWFTNKVAVEMIFYPIEFGGLRLRTFPNQPLGWIGWQGIVPAKAAVMAQRLTDMVTTKLLNVNQVSERQMLSTRTNAALHVPEQVFRRLDPDRVATLMAPGVDRIAEQARRVRNESDVAAFVRQSLIVSWTTVVQS